MKKFYLIIICNRINFLKNVHAFYSCTDIQVKIVHNLLVNLDQYKAPNIDFFFNQNTNPFERALQLLKNSNVSYCQLFSDDDFVFEDVICKSVDFLENNSDFVSCQGLLLNFDYRDTEICSPEKIDSSIINKEDDSKNKNFRFFQSLTSRFVDRIYSITKKEVLIDIIDTAKPLFKNYAQSIELYFIICMTMVGRDKAFQEIGWMKGQHENNLHKIDKYTFDYWIFNKNFIFLLIACLNDFSKRQKIKNFSYTYLIFVLFLFKFKIILVGYFKFIRNFFIKRRNLDKIRKIEITKNIYNQNIDRIKSVYNVILNYNDYKKL